MLAIITLPYHKLQKFVDGIGMYRMVSGSLGILAVFSIVAGFLGALDFSAQSQIFTLATALVTALSINFVIGRLFSIPANHESAVITALILFFLVIPEENILANWPLVVAVALGVISKFLITDNKQHFINPAAFGAMVVSVTGIAKFSWWVSNPTLFIPLVVLGVLVVMKVRKWVPVLAFLVVSLIIYSAEAYSYGEVMTDALITVFLSWPILFLAFFMLTEPFTMPSTKEAQLFYGGLVGFLASTSLFAGFFSMTPELALVIGNIALVGTRLRQKLHLRLKSRELIAKDTYECTFEKPANFNFKSGQYLEWMLPHKNPDTRGVRRYFTIAASPTEDEVKLAFKKVEESSSYKNALMKLNIGEVVTGSQLAGDFLLPKTTDSKLGFIAGGIGITPFRSHLQYMMDSDRNDDTVLFYCNNTKQDIAYKDFLATAEELLTFSLVPVISGEPVEAPYESGYVSADIIKRRAPDYLDRYWYISGPPVMVNASVKILRSLGVKKRNIKKDFFPGLA